MFAFSFPHLIPIWLSPSPPGYYNALSGNVLASYSSCAAGTYSLAGASACSAAPAGTDILAPSEMEICRYLLFETVRLGLVNLCSNTQSEHFCNLSCDDFDLLINKTLRKTAAFCSLMTEYLQI